MEELPQHHCPAREFRFEGWAKEVEGGRKGSCQWCLDHDLTYGHALTRTESTRAREIERETAIAVYIRSGVIDTVTANDR